MTIVLLTVAYILLSVVVAFLGRWRKFGFWGYFFCSLLLTPILGLLFVIASGPGCRPTRHSAFFGL